MIKLISQILFKKRKTEKSEKTKTYNKDIL